MKPMIEIPLPLSFQDSDFAGILCYASGVPWYIEKEIINCAVEVIFTVEKYRQISYLRRGIQ